MKEKTCRQRWATQKNGRIRDLEKLWPLCTSGDETPDPDLGTLDEYGLDFEFVPADSKGCGYFRWLLSTGGPADEFRFYTSADLGIDRIEYWFLDWYDGHGRALVGTDFALLLEIWGDYFRECGAPACALEWAEVAK